MAVSMTKSGPPLWTRLDTAWKSSGHHGLTFPFLCAGVGEQPKIFVKDLVSLGPHLTFCEYRRRPVLNTLLVACTSDVSDGGRVTAVARACSDYFRLIAGMRPEPCISPEVFMESLEAYLMHRILLGEVSVHDGDRNENASQVDGPFSVRDAKFIWGVLGDGYPPEVVGPTSKGGIKYAWRSGKGS